MTFPLKMLLASSALLVSAGGALAATGTATTDLNVRSGPGTQYPVVDTMPAGETVHVLGCSGDWCEVSIGAGGAGFASAAYLDMGGRVVEPSRMIIEEDEPEIVTGLSIGGYWDSRPYYYNDGYYYWGGRWYGRRPGMSGWQGSWRRDYRRGRAWDERRDAWRQREGDRGREARRYDDRRGGDVIRSGRGDRGDRFEGRGDRGGRIEGRDEARRAWNGGTNGPMVRDRDRGGDGGRGRGGDMRAERGGGERGGGERGGGERGGGDRGDRLGLDRAGGGGGGDRGGGGRGWNGGTNGPMGRDR